MTCRRAAALAAAWTLGCHPPAADSQVPDSGVGPAGRSGAESTAEVDTPPSPRCGPAGEMLHGLSWVPATAELTALVGLQAEGLDEALAALVEQTRTGKHGMPLDVAFGLAQWDFQVPLLRATLRGAGFEPAQLAAVRLESVGTFWVFGSTCDLEEAIDRVKSAWGVQVRRTATGAIGTPASDTPATFPFDVVFLPGDRIGLVAAGRGPDLVRALQERGSSGSETPPPGPIVEALPEAPIRAFVRGTGFGSGDTEAGQRFRVTDEGVEIGGSLPPSP